MQKQYFVDKTAPLAQSLWQMLQNLSLVQLLRRVSLPLLANCFFSRYMSLCYSVFKYSLTLSSRRNRWLFIPIAFYIRQRSIRAVIQLLTDCYESRISSQDILILALQFFPFKGQLATFLMRKRSSLSFVTVLLLQQCFCLQKA